METLISILMDIDDEIAWEKEMRLIDDRILDSFGVITLIAALEEAFRIEIQAGEITPENFNSAEAMWNMICRLQEK